MSEPYWVALAGAGIDYKGDWASATAYISGDVVRWNGIDYLAVNPSTGSAPPRVAAAGQELAYAQFTSDKTVNVNTPGTPVNIVTAPAFTVDGATPVMIEFWAPGADGSVADSLVIELHESGARLAVIALLTVSPNWTTAPIHSRWRLTPEAGAHTWNVGAWRLGTTTAIIHAGTATGVLATAGEYVPGFIRITRAA